MIVSPLHFFTVYHERGWDVKGKENTKLGGLGVYKIKSSLLTFCSLKSAFV